MRNVTIRQVTLTALLMAMVTVATMLIQVPVPATKGFINIGDTVIFVAALMLGPRAGLAAGGLGSALADVLSGYAHWAPWTLVIKGLEGLIAGAIGARAFRRGGVFGLRPLLGLGLAAAWMVGGYYLAGGAMMGFKAAAAEVPGNLIQGFGSTLIAAPLLAALRRLNIGQGEGERR